MKRSECLKFAAKKASDELYVGGQSGTRLLWSSLYKGDGSYFPQAMGYTTAFGVGLALGLPRRRVVVFDGDGSIFLNTGILVVIGLYQPKHLTVVIFDNEIYESSGKIPTPSGRGISIEALARAAGIKDSVTVNDIQSFAKKYAEAQTREGPHFIVAKVEAEELKLPQPATDARETKYKFVRYVERTEGVKIITPPRGTQPG